MRTSVCFLKMSWQFLNYYINHPQNEAYIPKWVPIRTKQTPYRIILMSNSANMTLIYDKLIPFSTKSELLFKKQTLVRIKPTLVFWK